MAQQMLVRSGKVRDVYDIGEHYLMVASDRISAFDWVIPIFIFGGMRVFETMICGVECARRPKNDFAVVSTIHHNLITLESNSPLFHQ